MVHSTTTCCHNRQKSKIKSVFEAVHQSMLKNLKRWLNVLC